MGQSCQVKVFANKEGICKGAQAQLRISLADTLPTSLTTNNSQRGNMFTLVAKNDIIITHFDGHPQSDTKYAIYYKTGTYVGAERDSTLWTLLGRHYNVKSNGTGYATRIPIYFRVQVKKGDSVSFYVSSTTSVSQNYLNGSVQHAVFSTDNNLFMREGVGLDWPFTHAAITGIFAPRVWNGTIYYELDAPKTVKWSTSETTDTIYVRPTKSTTYFADVNFGTCKLRDSVRITVENLSVDLGPDRYLCAGGSIQLDGGTAPKGTKYTWSPGGPGNRLRSYSAGGVKSVSVVTPFGCKYTDTVVINDVTSPSVSLGSDKDLCEGDTLYLDPGTYGAKHTFKWNTNDTTRRLMVTAGGKFAITVKDSFGCEGKGSVEVFQRATPVPDLGKDKEICEGKEFVLDAGFSDGKTTYLWSTTETTKTISITKTGNYSVLVTTEFGCQGRDTATYFFHGNPTSPMDRNVFACKGSEILLDAGGHGPGSAYSWSTGQTTQTVKTTNAGDFLVTITDSFKCTYTDTITVVHRKLPKVDLGANLTICEGYTAKLDAGYNDGKTHYAWSTSDTTKDITVSASGTYSVVVTDSFGCANSDEVTVVVFPLPVSGLGPDTSVCSSETLTLDPGSHAKYLWSNAATTRTITVGPGTYSVEITGASGCTLVDEITVSLLPTPESSFTHEVAGGQAMAFESTSSHAVGHKWNFGDGGTATGKKVTHWYKTSGDYTVTLKATNRCGEDESSYSVKVDPSGLPESTRAVFSVYPNPANGSFMVEGPAGNLHLAIVTLQGKTLDIVSVPTANGAWKVDLAQLPAPGIYLLQATTDDGLRWCQPIQLGF
ncbi:MAG: PKD domain-containing protein [Bacteroidetes bacterium]|nr:PKD domain-containing protein [Bacteroidota bacterium]